MDTYNIIKASDTMFSILKSAFKETSNTNEKLLEISIKEKVDNNENQLLGKFIDIYI